MAPKKKASGNGSSRVVRYMECRRNHADASSGATTDALDGCRAFKKVSTAEPEVCATCGCHRSFHRKDVVYRAPPRPSPLHFATMAAVVTSGHSLSSPEQEAPSPPPPLAPPSCWVEIDEKLKPPKKRRSSLEAAKTWSKRSSGGE
ncbi:mini zinc finger protein 2-like [Actinidia eriantha]|uniref:mini zinc finger protein 2-like n=1 Tax=Actinidia eriantha TaxID=165200 RepID=UPI002585C310|nr:mini zinc finger protein 2-like [Actinidia eriantha]